MGFFNIFKKKNKKNEDEESINQEKAEEIENEESSENDSHPKENEKSVENNEIKQSESEKDDLEENIDEDTDKAENDEIIEDEESISQEKTEEIENEESAEDDIHPKENEKSVENNEIKQSESEKDDLEENIDEDTDKAENEEIIEDEKNINQEKTEEIENEESAEDNSHPEENEKPLENNEIEQSESKKEDLEENIDEDTDKAENKEIIEYEESISQEKTEKNENEESSENDSHPEENEKPEKKDEKKGLFRRLRRGLSKTSNKIVGGMESVFLGKKEIDEDLLEELEELLITADMGVTTSLNIIEEVREEVSRKILKNPQELKTALKKKIYDILNVDNSLVQTEDRPYVILVIGVNGVGKTTSIAKLANMFKNEGLKTMLAAGDTFRAAAVDQLKIWADRVGVPVVAQQEGSDPAAVIFDAVQSAKAKKFDVLIADTAGRLHTKYNLMNELGKVIRVMKKELPDAPHELLLVLDATAGQNAISQAKQFQSMIGATGIILTKLDGTAKGGVIVGIVDELKIPVKFIGFGEGMEDLRPFNAKSFVDALFADESDEDEQNK